MEVFEIHRIVDHLIPGMLRERRLTDFELDDEYNMVEHQHDINSFTETRHHILKVDLATALKRRENVLQDEDLLDPSIALERFNPSASDGERSDNLLNGSAQESIDLV